MATLTEIFNNASEDSESLSSFITEPSTSTVYRRLATPIKPLSYYLDYLQGLELVYSQQTGSVDVNGVSTKTVTQSIQDAINSNASVFKGDSGTIDSVTTTTGVEGSNASVTLGGTPSSRTMAFTIPKGDKGVAANILGATATTGAAGSNVSVTTGGNNQSRTFAFTIPRGDKGEKGDSGTIDSVTTTTVAAGSQASVTLGGTPSSRTMTFNIPRGDKGETGELADIYANTTSNTPNVYIGSDGTYERSTYQFGTAASKNVGLAQGNLVERGADGYPVNNNAIGVGQTWQDVTASRANRVVYTNTTGRTIFIAIAVIRPAQTRLFSLEVDGIVVSSMSYVATASANQQSSMYSVVPNGSSYKVVFANDGIEFWSELR